MNLFILDRDPITSAKMNCDKHVCKIILEAVQMMSLAHIEHGTTTCMLSTGLTDLYNARTHRNNHVSKWVRETTQNYHWTAQHGLTLCEEYTNRYGKRHKCQDLMEWCATHLPPLPSTGLTNFRQAVADDCYHTDPVIAYHVYYVKYKRYFAKWKLGNTPTWFSTMCTAIDNKA
jgi:hypothetical protein